MSDAPPLLQHAQRRARWRAWAAALTLILAGGAVRLPVEAVLTTEMRAAHFGTVQMDLNLREKIGQLGFLAALSGFRSLVADFVWIEAHTAWENVQYGRMDLLLGTATTLQPRNTGFWDVASWHMAYNASVHARDDKEDQPAEALRNKAAHDYIMLGRSYAERGIANNPDSRDLWLQLATIDRDKLHDPCAASPEFERASECPHAFGFERRFAAYCLADCPGHEREAYRLLRSLYDMGPRERLPTLEARLRQLEEKLNIPPEQRVYK